MLCVCVCLVCKKKRTMDGPNVEYGGSQNDSTMSMPDQKLQRDDGIRRSITNCMSSNNDSVDILASFPISQLPHSDSALSK